MYNRRPITECSEMSLSLDSISVNSDNTITISWIATSEQLLQDHTIIVIEDYFAFNDNEAYFSI